MCETVKMDAKLKILSLINEHKGVLFGTYASNLGRSEKEKIWDNIAVHARQLGLIGEGKNGRHMREITWQNWRKRSIVSCLFILCYFCYGTNVACCCVLFCVYLP